MVAAARVGVVVATGWEAEERAEGAEASAALVANQSSTRHTCSPPFERQQDA